MSTDFTQGNKPLEAAIAACTSPQQVAEVLQRHKEANGLASFDNRYCELPQPSADRMQFMNVEVTPGCWVRVEGYKDKAELDGIVEVLRRRAVQK